MEENNGNIQNETSSGNDDQVIAILSYIGILWVVAYVLYGNKKSDYNMFHLRQGLGLFIIAIVFYILSYILAFVPFLGSLIMLVLWIAVLIFMILGIINAANGEKKELPIIGKLISDNLKGFK